MLAVRVRTAVLILLLVVGLLLWAPWMVRCGFFVALGLWAALEWSSLVSRKPVVRGCFVALLIAGFGGAEMTIHAGCKVMIWLAAAVVFWLWMTWYLVSKSDRLHVLTKWFSGFWVLVPAAVAMTQLMTIVPSERGSALLLLCWAVVAAADVGAYFSGRAFGRRKLAPTISPGKTWEGVLGGAVLALIVGYIGAVLLTIPSLPFVGVSLVVIGASVVGDLTESLFKRHAGVKDSGSLLPGHGGILDRIDGLVAALPVFVLGLQCVELWH
jgi:phosphatidate cytidylyltransferase